ARDGNGQMQARMLPIRPAQVVPHRSERGLRAASALLLVGERRLRLGPIADGFGLQVLGLAFQVGGGGALDGERLLQGKAGAVEADEAVAALPERVVG